MGKKWGKSAKFQIVISHYFNINWSKYIRIRFKCDEIPLWGGKKRFIKFGKVLEIFKLF